MESLSTSCALSDSEDQEWIESCPTTANRIATYSNEITFKEQVQICFKPSYRMRKVKTKGALLVLVWNFFVTCTYYYINYKSQTPEKYFSQYFKLNLIVIPVALVLPFTGWLADVYFSRYKVLLSSIAMMWISALLLTTVFVIESIISFTNYIQLLLLSTLGIGYGCFQANIIQFGIDQLTDASSDEIISFVNWYSWTYISSGVLANHIYKCTSTHGTFIAPLFLLVVLSIVVMSGCMCNGNLIKEPVTQNPFKLMYQVVNYAIKHKFPRLRSAFTYCEDAIPSRIDLGKSKYGGPFTTEQVEDVKTFFRALGLVVLVGAIFGMTDDSKFNNRLLSEVTAIQRNKTSHYSTCSLSFVFTDAYYIAVAVFIPLNETILYPLFHRCLVGIKRYWMIFWGAVLQILGYIVQITIFVISRKHYIMKHEASMIDTINDTMNMTAVPCVYQHKYLQVSSSIYDYRLNILAEVLFSTSYATMLIGSVEFLCAQIPYSMKGLTVGIFYSSLVLFLVLNYGISLTFNETASSWNTETSLSCGFWYLLIKLLMVLIALTALFLLSSCYKKRAREDVLPNEHIFAERFYSK